MKKCKLVHDTKKIFNKTLEKLELDSSYFCSKLDKKKEAFKEFQIKGLNNQYNQAKEWIAHQIRLNHLKYIPERKRMDRKSNPIGS